MLRKFKINIDGQEYMVEMEEIGGVPAPAPVAPAPVAQAPAAPQAPAQEAPQEAAPQPTTVPAGADALEAPMPGTILQIFVEVGQQVQENEKLLVLEAMKMENEIVANKSGVITGIHVSKGDSVDSSAPLVTIG